MRASRACWYALTCLIPSIGSQQVARSPPAELSDGSEPSPPSPPPDIVVDAAYVLSSNEWFSQMSNDTKDSFTTDPKLARSFEATRWQNRDRHFVTTGLGLDSATGSSPQDVTLGGNLQEQANVAYLTRHGLYRRTDDKFSEFVARPTESTNDGYGMWRTWESHGNCPYELLIADPWGSLSWEAASHTALQPIDCSWVIRPGMYRHGGYFKLSRAPIALIFRSLSLASPIEKLTIYDGEHAGAPMIAQFTGQRVPDQISSTGPAVRVVLSADLNRTASGIWEAIQDAISRDALSDAQSRFLIAAKSRILGFYRQDMRRILTAMAIKLSSREDHRWMRRKWFGGDTASFDRAYNTSLATVLEDFTGWEKRHKAQEGKEGMQWESKMGPRRYPVQVLEPSRNPYYMESGIEGSLNVDVDYHVQLQRSLGHLPKRASGFSVDFTTNADCGGRGIAPYGNAKFPPLTVSSEPNTNFEFLEFPMRVSSCQAMAISGPQTTRDRPFTYAHTRAATHAMLHVRHKVDARASPDCCYLRLQHCRHCDEARPGRRVE